MIAISPRPIRRPACIGSPAARKAKLSYLGHTVVENRNGLVVAAMATQADGTAEYDAGLLMVADLMKKRKRRITLGADKGYDAAEFIEELHRMKVTPHVAQNKAGRRSAVADEIARSEGYAISQRKRKLIEQGFGWAKFVNYNDDRYIRMGFPDRFDECATWSGMIR